MASINLYTVTGLLLLVNVVPHIRASDDDGVYKIGVGIGDITGPPAGVVLVY